MRCVKEFIFWALLIAYTGVTLGLGYELAQSVRYDNQVRLVRADDGTPCYTYRGNVTCDFYQRAADTNGGRYPYATTPDPDTDDHN